MPRTFQTGDELPRLRHSATALQLFRYSAVTWNPHRIHFDGAYARDEGHEGLALHSHLRAALALRCITEGLGVGWRVDRFSYRLRKPVYAPVEIDYAARVTAVEGDSLTLEVFEHHPSGEAAFEGSLSVSRIGTNPSGAREAAASAS